MKILVIRCLQTDLLLRVVDQIKSTHPRSKISILTHADQVTLKYIKNEFDHIYTYDASCDFSLFRIRPSIIHEIRRQRFDLVVVAKHMDRIEGFENVVLMLPALGCKKWAHCAIDGIFHEIPKTRSLRVMATGILSVFPAIILYAGVLSVVLTSEIHRIIHEK